MIQQLFKKSNKTKNIVCITVLFSLIWTTLARIFSSLTGVTYNTSFLNSVSSFLSVAVPMFMTVLLFLYFVKQTKGLVYIKELYSTKHKEIQNPYLKIIASIIVIAMLLFACYNFYTNMGSIIKNWNSDSLPRILSCLISALCVGMTEETIFRGFSLRELRQNNNEWTSFIVQQILFGFWHLPNVIIGAPFLQSCFQVLFAIILGTGLYLSLRVTRSLKGAILFHAFWDFALFIAIT
ncbi:CPBP family intramembrane glutamic endopeptidase [Streptococcus gallinaceus]|uniref:Membrane protease YdiL (CAAX protease family) n=1 Tax=Streptococcus gallinaceus TaxID=165758 RepID=A0ABV2JMH2_9STRE|nr:type II CAAX endopeptidase family protein [Streptococcus gallinaceus]MCP1638849.1 membrane protease YdiL (CAAX protease family) [Streptococcus gallinaceus]MCP1769907.1 membrane protease YdiL (CAAX protease family) [Streptococcus gallinaceus]